MVAAGALSASLLGLAAHGCQFTFSYTEVVAPLGTVGEIGVRVQKDHNNCTLPSMDDYLFDWENIQVLGETAWEEIGNDLYEKWFQVSLSAVGDGYLRISKTCTKEGYEEAVLPIGVLAGADEGSWMEASSGTYPFELPVSRSIESVTGTGQFDHGVLQVQGLTFALPTSMPALENSTVEGLRVYYVEQSDRLVPLLVVGDELFLRYDHLLGDDA